MGLFPPQATKSMANNRNVNFFIFFLVLYYYCKSKHCFLVRGIINEKLTDYEINFSFSSKKNMEKNGA
ncbi:hypothetical protein CCAND95_760007 [Capnocytophaga canis]|nr:hypothetical protein CCAND95_760007 [Capnocytophaga canis]